MEYEEYLETAGFQDALIVDAKGDLNLYKDMWQSEGSDETELRETIDTCCTSEGSSFKKPANDLLQLDFNEWAGSFQNLRD